jgi:hypothetical protein
LFIKNATKAQAKFGKLPYNRKKLHMIDQCKIK